MSWFSLLLFRLIESKLVSLSCFSVTPPSTSLILYLDLRYFDSNGSVGCGEIILLDGGEGIYRASNKLLLSAVAVRSITLGVALNRFVEKHPLRIGLAGISVNNGPFNRSRSFNDLRLSELGFEFFIGEALSGLSLFIDCREIGGFLLFPFTFSKLKTF